MFITEMMRIPYYHWLTLYYTIKTASLIDIDNENKNNMDNNTM